LIVNKIVGCYYPKRIWEKKLSSTDGKIFINVTIDILPSTLKTIVENAKKIVGADEKGIYRVDTAEKVNEMVSAFLTEYDFDEYVKNPDNYNR
jgi:hypothetical protein